MTREPLRIVAGQVAVPDKPGLAIDIDMARVEQASELVVGVQCGGSDAFSGVTANPAVGFCTDLLVPVGATVMFSEVTEVRDAIDQLTSRAVDAEVANAMIRQMAWYDRYLQRGGTDRSANTTPGNKKAASRTSSRRPWGPW